MDYFLKRTNFAKTAAVYGANILLSFHFAFIIYINSTYLEEIFNSKTTGILYTIGSLLSILLFLVIPRIISHIGIFHTTLLLLISEFLAVIGLGFGGEPFHIALFFLLHTTVIALLFYILDVYLESTTTHENVTGNIRGFYLTFTNLAFVASPLVVGTLIALHGYSIIYIISAALLIPLVLVSSKWLSHIKTPLVEAPSIIKDIKKIFKNKKIFYPFFSQNILQLFFAFMTIYSPIYLITEIGFTWGVLGPIFTVMLLPYVLFELPVGYLADKKYGEKEFMIAGFLIIAAVMVAITLPTTPNVIVWSILLFLSRMGGSFTEITTETNFFRQVDGGDEGIISLFRLSRPLAYVLAALIGTLTLAYLSFVHLFLIIAGIILLSVIVLLPMKDSK